MTRVLAVCLAALGFAAAGLFSASVGADNGTTSVASTATTVATTTVATTTAPATTTTPSTPPANLVPDGISISGVQVGGLTPAAAVAALQDAFSAPLQVVVDRNRFELDPTRFATAYAALAVARARASSPEASVDLTVAVDGAALRAWVGTLAHRYRRVSRDASLGFRHGKPFVTPDRPGRELDSAALTRQLVAALTHTTRKPVRVRTRTVAPKVTAAQIGSVIVINRSLNRLQLWDGNRFVRAFPVATGQAIYPTPKGTFRIVVKWKNPWWYPPTQDAWAKGLKPVPPGPGNPLGTRWMGLSAPGVGIHGTDEPTSIGYSASHGCIRMQVPDAEWLFDRVDVGTTVFII